MSQSFSSFPKIMKLTKKRNEARVERKEEKSSLSYSFFFHQASPPWQNSRFYLICIARDLQIVHTKK